MRALTRALATLAGIGILASVLLVAIGTHDRMGPADLAVVPANAVRPDGSLSDRLRARCDRAVAVFRERLAPAILVSGGIDRRGVDEAECMRRYLIERGVPSAAIVKDSLGVDTWSTALHATAWLRARGLDRVLIVTQGFHVPRTRLAFGRIFGGQVFWTHARYWEARDLYSVPRELVALVKYALRPLPTRAGPGGRA